MKNIKSCFKTLEKLSLISCFGDTTLLIERALLNVKPILDIDTTGVEPLIWQNELRTNRLFKDKIDVKLSTYDLERNAAGFHEDYIAVGRTPRTFC